MALTLRTDEALDLALTELAESEGLSRQQVIKRAIFERHAQAVHSARVGVSSGRQKQYWSTTIDDLGPR